MSHGFSMSAVPVVVVLGAACFAAATDVWRFKVYNALTFPLLFSGLAYHGVLDGAAGLESSLAGLLFGFGALLFPYMLGAMGAGDVKFVAAVGAWLGFAPMLSILIVGCLATGAYAIVLMVYHGGYRQTWVSLQLIFMRLAMIGRHFGAEDNVETVQALAKSDERRQRLIPFSAMIGVGIIATFAWSIWGHTH